MVTDTLIPKGYQQTDVGVIPDDWEVKIVEQISDVKSGKRLPLGKSLIDSETTHPYIRITDMFQGGVSLNEIKYVPDDVYPAIKNYRIFKNDIFISVAGTLGMVGKIPTELDGANLTENADRLTNIKCDRDYLLYVLMSSLIQNMIESERTLGAQPKLALTRIRKFQIPLPSNKAEQTAIAIALSDANMLISKLEELITKKRNIKQGAMQELLTGKKRLPGFSGKWEDKSLENCGKLTMGQSPPGNSYSSNDVGMPLLNGAADLKEDGILITQYTTKPTRFSKKGDLLFCIRATIGNLQTSDKKYCLGRGVAALNVNVSYNKTFVAFQLQGLFEMMRRQSQGGVIKGLRKDELAEMIINVPKQIEEQTAIAQVLSDMDAEIDELEQKLDKYKMIKQGMMQELLTGKKRLI